MQEKMLEKLSWCLSALLGRDGTTTFNIQMTSKLDVRGQEHKGIVGSRQNPAQASYWPNKHAISMVLCYTRDIVLDTWYCATHMVLRYTHDTVLHTWYSATHMVLHCTHGTALHTWYCATHGTVLHTQYCATHTQSTVLHIHSTVLHTWYCAATPGLLSHNVNILSTSAPTTMDRGVQPTSSSTSWNPSDTGNQKRPFLP